MRHRVKQSDTSDPINTGHDERHEISQKSPTWGIFLSQHYSDLMTTPVIVSIWTTTTSSPLVPTTSHAFFPSSVTIFTDNGISIYPRSPAAAMAAFAVTFTPASVSPFAFTRITSPTIS